MHLLSLLRDVRRRKYISSTSTCSTTGQNNPILAKFETVMTPYSYDLLAEQYKMHQKVEVISKDTVKSSSGILTVTNDTCGCACYTTLKIPCRHIFAIRVFNKKDLFSETLVNNRWRNDFYLDSKVPIIAPSVIKPTVSRQIISKPQRRVLSECQKFKKVRLLTDKLANLISQCGMSEFQDKYNNIEEMLSMYQSGSRVLALSTVKQCKKRKCDSAEPTNKRKRTDL